MTSSYLGILVLLGAFGCGASFAQDIDYLTLDKVTISKVQVDVLNQEISEKLLEKHFERQETMQLPGMPTDDGLGRVDKAGKVISVGRELVALGEDIYRLVQKGKPVNKTDYAPISVIPKTSSGYADILDTEGWRMPTKVTYSIVYENLYGMEVVKFRYSIIFSYGGSYNGKGAYLTAAQIIPESVETLFGYSFGASMKLGGIQNHGTKDNPVAGAILSMEHTVETVIKASLESSSYHITGRGGFKEI
jgi:hypothetical protein